MFWRIILSLAVTGFWASGLTAAAAPDPDTPVLIGKRVIIFVLTGQSNSLGTTADRGEKDRAPGADPLDARIPFFWSNRTTRSGDGPAVLFGDSGGKIVSLRPQQGEGDNPRFWGPEIGFGRRLAAAGTTGILIVKASRGGGGNSFWMKNSRDDHMYRHVVRTVLDAVSALPKGTDFNIAALLYVQGESDSEQEARASGERLLALARNLREDLPHAENMRVIVGGIAAAGKNSDIVRARQSELPATDPTFRYINTLDLRQQLYDHLHFNKKAKLELGIRMADAWMAGEVPERALELPPGKGNPRNSEGAFVTLKDGRILFVYSHFTGGGGDHSAAHLAGRYSADGGRTWTAQDRVIVPNEGGMNVMSVSLLRLRSGEIALFYLLKNSEEDCRPVMRLSRDEGETWGDAAMCVTDEAGYYVMNNDRAIQLAGGRLVLPLCLHWPEGQAKADWQGTLMCYLSDDNGKSWRRGKSAHKTFDAAGRRVTTQEPGVVELKDGRVMMFIRASGGCQYLSWSADGGDTWTPPVPSDIRSPVSPASIKRLPSTGDLLLVWNNHDGIPDSLNNKRVPLSTAVSRDDGRTWQHVRVLEGNPKGHYCYIAIHVLDDAVLLGYCAMSGLGHSRVTRVPVAWLYGDQPEICLHGFFND